MKKTLFAALLALVLAFSAPGLALAFAKAAPPANTGTGEALPRPDVIWRAEATGDFQVMQFGSGGPAKAAPASASKAKAKTGGSLPRLDGIWRAEGSDDYQVMHIEIDASARSATFSEGPKSRTCVFAVEKESPGSITLFLKEPRKAVTFEIIDKDNIRIREGAHERLLTRVRSFAAPGQPGPAAPPVVTGPGPVLPESSGKIHTPLNRPRYLPDAPAKTRK